MWDLYRNLNKLHMGNKVEGNPHIGKLLDIIESKRNWYQANCKSAKADWVLFGYCFRSLGRASGDRGLGTPRVGVWGRGSQPNAEGLRLRRGMRGARLKVSLNRDRSLWAATRATCLTSHVEATTHTPKHIEKTLNSVRAALFILFNFVLPPLPSTGFLVPIPARIRGGGSI
jgi:hypothetical protein